MAVNGLIKDITAVVKVEAFSASLFNISSISLNIQSAKILLLTCTYHSSLHARSTLDVHKTFIQRHRRNMNASYTLNLNRIVLCDNVVNRLLKHHSQRRYSKGTITRPSQIITFRVHGFSCAQNRFTCTSVHVGNCARKRADVHVTNNNMIRQYKLH